jgi:hypothetical protein
MPRFRLIDRVLSAFRGVEGFEPYTFVGDVYPTSLVKGEWSAAAWRQPGITRSIRYDPEGPSSWIRVHGSPRTAWHRRAVRDLERAGYTTKHRFKDETVCQRWLRGKREFVAELRFLERFAPDGSEPPSTTTPRRRTRPHTRTPRSPTLLEALESARGAAIEWDEWFIGVLRRSSAPDHGTRTGSGMIVSALGCESTDERWIETCVSVFGTPDQDRPMPIGLRRALLRELRAAGYRVNTRAGLFGMKRVATANGAVRECTHIFSRLIHAVDRPLA